MLLLELTALGAAGLFAGAGLSASKQRAPSPLAITFYVFAGVAVVLAALALRSS